MDLIQNEDYAADSCAISRTVFLFNLQTKYCTIYKSFKSSFSYLISIEFATRYIVIT